MKRFASFVLVLVAILWIAPLTIAQTPITETDAPYGYVELTGPRTYHIVSGDTLWDLTPNQWRMLQAAPGNERLTAAWRVSTTASGLYRVHLTVNEPIQIPAGMTIRVRLERPTNFVDDPERGGQPFVENGLRSDDDVRNSARDSAMRDFLRRNPGGTLQPDTFEIVGNIERGTLHGPGIVYFRDQPNEARPTIYTGERGYRARVRNRATGEETTQLFLQGCGNDARQGNFLQAGGGEFRFVPDGTIPGNPNQPAPNSNENGWPWKFIIPAALLLLVAGIVGLAWLRPSWFTWSGYPSIPQQPVTPIAAEPIQAAAAVASDPPALEPEPAREPEPAPLPMRGPQAVASAMPTSEEEPIATLVLEGVTYEAPASSNIRVVKSHGKYRVQANGEITVTMPPKAKPREVRRKPAATGTDNNH